MRQILQLHRQASATTKPARSAPQLKLVRGSDQQHIAQELAAIAEQLQPPLTIDAVPALFERLKALVNGYWLDPEASADAAQLLLRLRARDLRFDDAAGLLLHTLQR
jgi:hypothetical protein